MAYEPLQPSSSNDYVTVPSFSALQRSRSLRRSVIRFDGISHHDELPLLDASSFKSSASSRIDAVDTAYGGSLTGPSTTTDNYLHLETLHEPRRSQSIRAWLSSAYRYVRASGPARSPEQSAQSSSRWPTGWRLGTYTCCMAVVLCIILELSLVIYGVVTSRKHDGAGVLLEGNCEAVRELELWLLLPLNIAGTVLIGTSNYVMQVVSAPDRAEIDQAHAFAESIAVAGIRFKDLWLNRRNKFRRSIWWILGLSSVPIHFFLNVAVYSSVQASNTGVLVVSEDFDRDTGWDYCRNLPSNPSSAETIACSLYQNYTNHETVLFPTSQCLQQYSDGFQTNASSVIVVTEQNAGRWFNPPTTVDVPNNLQFGLACRAQYATCNSSYSGYYDEDSNETCLYGYELISDRKYLFDVNATSYANISLNFSPFCENKTEKNSAGVVYSWEIVTTDNSEEYNVSSFNEVFLRETDALANVSSIKAFFSAFQYRYWATGSVTGDYLQTEAVNMLDSKDPRSWLCPRSYLESNQQCDPLELQKESEWRITPESMLVKECHVLPKEERCVLRYNFGILILTICFDVVKLSAMIATIKRLRQPLTTLGDVIESFLHSPDPYTQGWDVIDDDEVSALTIKICREIRARGYNYLKERFGIDILIWKRCKFCGRRVRLSRMNESINFKTMADHPSCGLFPARSPQLSRFEEQCFEWLCEGGTWWTEFASDETQQMSKIEQQRRWYKIPSRKRWSWSVRLYIPALTIAVGYFGINLQSLITQRLANPWIVGFDAPDPNSMLTGGLSRINNIYGAGALVNAPQLAFSMLYFIFNATLTAMHTAHEWASFAVHRKALRVSSPRGLQRSTYWLQLPWSYSVPLVITSGSMHWLLSRSLYIVKVDVYGYLGERETDRDYFACGYSPIPALLLVIVLVLMAISLAVLSFRPLPIGMPFVRLNSLAIAAACHPNPAETELELKPLKWGMLSDYRSRNGQPRFSFSAEEVIPVRRTNVDVEGGGGGGVR